VWEGKKRRKEKTPPLETVNPTWKGMRRMESRNQLDCKNPSNDLPTAPKVGGRAQEKAIGEVITALTSEKAEVSVDKSSKHVQLLQRSAKSRLTERKGPRKTNRAESRKASGRERRVQTSDGISLHFLRTNKEKKGGECA